MIINILYFAELKDITNKENEKFELESRDIKELINLLIKKYPSLQDLIWDQKIQNLRDTISIIINNQAIHVKDNSSKELNDGDTIAFLLPVSGG